MLTLHISIFKRVFPAGIAGIQKPWRRHQNKQQISPCGLFTSLCSGFRQSLPEWRCTTDTCA